MRACLDIIPVTRVTQDHVHLIFPSVLQHCHKSQPWPISGVYLRLLDAIFQNRNNIFYMVGWWGREDGMRTRVPMPDTVPSFHLGCPLTIHCSWFRGCSMDCVAGFLLCGFSPWVPSILCGRHPLLHTEAGGGGHNYSKPFSYDWAGSSCCQAAALLLFNIRPFLPFLLLLHLLLCHLLNPLPCFPFWDRRGLASS